MPSHLSDLPPREFYRELAGYLEPWSSIVTWGDEFISHEISDATHGGPSHIRTVLGAGAWHSGSRVPVFAEMTWPHARLGTIYEIKPKTLLEVGRHTELHRVSPRDQLRAIDWIERMIILERQYDAWELLANLCQELGLPLGDFSHKHQTVCSSFNGRVFQLMGIPWTLTDPLLSPQDIRMSQFYEPVINGGL